MALSKTAALEAARGDSYLENEGNGMWMLYTYIEWSETETGFIHHYPQTFQDAQERRCAWMLDYALGLMGLPASDHGFTGRVEARLNRVLALTR